MIKPKTPKSELNRLETLRSLNILDTLPEDNFDRVTRIAQKVFDVPISLVSLVDKERQWFKSVQGIDVSETSRDISFCGHAILGDDIFHVPNALEDERFFDNPLVTGDPSIRFYAGHPIKATNGYNVGTLCLIDQKPRVLTDEEKVILKDLASIINQELRLMDMASFDDLTNLYNRRSFISFADNVLRYSSRNSEKISILYFDLNKFKEINDNFGHDQGDKALVSFANIMKETFRDSDILCRIGGDEFVVLLKNIDIPKTEHILDRFNYNMNYFNQNSKTKYNIEYSVGFINMIPTNKTRISELLKASDVKMYENKVLNKDKIL